jgi:hypothetical protein
VVGLCERVPGGWELLRGVQRPRSSTIRAARQPSAPLRHPQGATTAHTAPECPTAGAVMVCARMAAT